MQRDNKSLTFSVLVNNYNGKELLEKNLPKVINAKKNTKNNIQEIIVVDDFSSDDSLKYLNGLKSEISLIKHTKTRGFAASINTGVRAAKGDFIVILNNNVSPKDDFLENILDMFEDKQKQVKIQTKQKVFGVALHTKDVGFVAGTYDDGFVEQKMGKDLNRVAQSLCISSSGVFRKSIWKELGGMDEKLLSSLTWLDFDLCYRACKRGYVCLWYPKPTIITETSPRTISDSEKDKFKNQILFMWKNIHSQAMFKKHLSAIVKKMFKNSSYFKIVLSVLIKLPIVLKLRRKEIKESIVSDEAIFSRFS